MRTGAIFSPVVAIPKKAFSGICLRIFYLTVLLSPVHTFSQSNNCDEVPVTLVVEHFGRTELPSILCGKQVYFSVTGLFQFLQVKNEPSHDFKIVEGFLQHQEDTFFIDEPAKQISYKNNVFQLDSADLIRTKTTLFLRSDHFSKIFGLQNEFSSRNLAATLVPDFELPAVKAAKRKQMRENLRRVNGEISADTTILRDRPLIHFGTAAWNVNTTQRTDGLFNNRLGLGLGGLLAGGEFTGNINYNSGMDITSQNLFYQWRHVNNQNQLFRQFTAGKIASRSISSIYHPVVGIQITNAPTFVKRSFGTYTLSDHTKPDWIVELYINNLLVDYTQADASGFFSFDVPLTYGSTQVSLRYYGPFGEEEISNKNFNIPFNFLSYGEFQYTVSSGMVEDGKNSKFFQGRADYGLTERITLGGGIEYLSSLEENPVIPFLNTSVRLPANMLFSGEYMHKVGYKGNFSYTSPSSLRLDLSYKKFEEAQEAVLFSYLEERKASLTFPVQVGKFTGISRVNFQQIVLRNNSYTHLEWLLSGSAWGLRANLTSTAFINQYSDPLVYSRLSTSIRFPGNFVFSPKVEYEYLRDGLTSFEGEVRKRLFKKVNFQASYTHNIRIDQFYINVGFSFDLGFTRLAMNSSVNKGYTSFSQSAGGSIMFEPSDNSLAFDHRPMIGRGSIKFEPFLDLNENGNKDQSEPSIEGLNVYTQGGGMREQTPDGSILFRGLEPYISYHFQMDTRNLKNIAWQVDHESMEVFVNPNQMKVVGVPVKVMGEVAGFVNLGHDGIGGIRVNIVDYEGKLVSSVLSASDGYFSYMGLQSGNYIARVDKTQLEKLKMKTNEELPFIINNTREGDYVDNLEFLLAETVVLQSAPDDIAAEEVRESEGLFEEPSENYNGHKTVSEEGLVYKVQFLTSKEPLTEGQQALRGLEHVEREKSFLGYNYLWGYTTLSGEATRLQNELRKSGFKDAYVAHYYNGKRISVEAAVSIRNGIAQRDYKPNGLISEAVQEPEIPQTEIISEKEQGGLKFRVQVAASEVQMKTTDARFMGLQGVEEYWHEEMFKYSLGNFRSFGEANQFKNVLRIQGLSDAFVVPFQGNERLNRGQARGVIYFRDSSIKGIGGISLEISDTAGKYVSTILSEADGSFVTPTLEPGVYTLKLDSEALEQIGMKPVNLEMTVKIGEEGYIYNSEIEFFLSATNGEAVASTRGIQDEGLVFRVQVLATVPKLPVAHKLLKGLKGVERYKHKGLYKYTVGESRKLEEIRKTRNKVLKSGFEDAFIVSFLNGVRINLQEMSGQIFVKVGREKMGLEGISLRIFDKEEKQITNLVSDRDGKFSFLGLKAGSYTARLDAEQLDNLGLKAGSAVRIFEIQRNTEGKIRELLIFTLEKEKNMNIFEAEAKDANIEYRIQLAASNVRLGPNHPTLKGIDNISMYQHNGMFKYTIGSTYSLSEARELMEKIRAYHEFSIFIVGFKEGVRIIVLE